MDKVLFALKNKIPYAVISVGATEAFVMAQYHILSEEEILNSKETLVANMQYSRGHEHRGITIPNIEARDLAIDAVRVCDIVGYNIICYKDDSGEFTEKVFERYDIWRSIILKPIFGELSCFHKRKNFMKC